MREAHRRDPFTGAGNGEANWLGLALGMVVLDTLSGNAKKVGERFQGLLVRQGVPEDDAAAVYELRCSLLHGYGLPESNKIGGRRLVLTADWSSPAVDSTSDPGEIAISVPIFCSHLVERIAFAAQADWDETLIDTSATLPQAHAAPVEGLPFRPLSLDTWNASEPVQEAFAFRDRTTGAVTPMTPSEWARSVIESGILRTWRTQ
jgi:hypothetical protein